jgi:hypothetical protein
MINTCTQRQDEEELKGEELSLLPEASSFAPMHKASPSLYKSIILNTLSKQTLDVIRKATSLKATPSPVLNFTYQNKRVNSNKPTPCLESKLSELRDGNNTLRSLERMLDQT